MELLRKAWAFMKGSTEEMLYFGASAGVGVLVLGYMSPDVEWFTAAVAGGLASLTQYVKPVLSRAVK